MKLREEVLPDNCPVYVDFLYVCDGKVIKSEVTGTVSDLKRDLREIFNLKAKKITNYDFSGREAM
jgi:hypothetical protein